ncbi:hypothetical protein CABS01_13883 [Colletotrichum abscissum]|nr:hypothetical protein CABS01_13883 [Colletotrichum abscissum]
METFLHKTESRVVPQAASEQGSSHIMD